MRRFAAVVRVVRRPVAWLPLLLLAWLWYLWGEVTPPPRHVVRVGGPQAPLAANNWRNLQAVSDDGGEVIVSFHHDVTRDDDDVRLEMWDTRTGENRTPRLWRDVGWRAMFSMPGSWSARLKRLAADPSGREFLRDEAAWSALGERFAAAHREQGPGTKGDPGPLELFPSQSHFSPDGRFLAYATRGGRPVFPGSPDRADGAAVEDVRTGERVATLPMNAAVETERIAVVAPGGLAAVSVAILPWEWGSSRVSLWDLATSRCLADLSSPHAMPRMLDLVFRADGRYVFLRFAPNLAATPALRWWDAATGRQVGHVPFPTEWALMDGGRVLVTHPPRSTRPGGSAKATGSVSGTWRPARRSASGSWTPPATPAG